MLGIIGSIFLSWLLLNYVQHKSLAVLGLRPTPSRMRQLGTGLALAMVFFVLFELIVSALVHNPYHFHEGYHLAELGRACWSLFKSIAFEDLLFRGALLYIAMERLGAQKGLLLSAVTFGIYHWFSWNAFGNPSAMLVIFLMTASAGYVFALAFERTGSMYLGAGLHFGVDFASAILFSQDKGFGQQLLVRTYAKDPVTPASWIVILVIIIHFTGFQILSFWLLKRMKKVKIDHGNDRN